MIIMWISIIFVILILHALVIFILVKEKYKSFIKLNSKAIKKLLEINEKYSYLGFEKHLFFEEYDNEDYFYNISCEDVLIYNLDIFKQDIINEIKQFNKQRNEYEKYKREVVDFCILGQYTMAIDNYNKKWLDKLENKLFNSLIKKELGEYSINVEMELRTMSGYFKDRKTASFSIRTINNILHKINQKRGTYYINKDIFDSLCRVERGKVTNKIRFMIFERDGYCCRYCGSKQSLQIDHIQPISKGGKSTPNNLQTLCKWCNEEKGSHF